MKSPWLSLLVFVLVGTIITSCRAREVAVKDTLPPDLAIIATVGSLVPGEEEVIVEIRRNGEGLYAKVFTDEPAPPLEELAFTAAEEDLLELWKVILANDFFALDSLYSDPTVNDGSLATLTVTADGRTHRVELENVSLPRLETILNAINEITPAGKDLIYVAMTGDL